MSRPGTSDVVPIGIPDEDAFEGDEPILPGWDIPIARHFTHPGAAAKYEYDFGDGWEHAVTLEAIVPRQKGVRYPRCLGGHRRSPHPRDPLSGGGCRERSLHGRVSDALRLKPNGSLTRPGQRGAHHRSCTGFGRHAGPRRRACGRSAGCVTVSTEDGSEGTER
jgi:hypothetical protein